MYSNFFDFLNRMNRLSEPEIIRRQKTYKKRINPMEELEEDEFEQKYRFSKANMLKLINLVRDDLDGDKRGGRIPVNIQVMAAIRYWGRNKIQDDCADMHGLSQPTLSNLSAKVAQAFASKSVDYITMPRTTSAQLAVMDGFKLIHGLPHVIGAIGCTHIRIQRPGRDTGRLYINKRGYYSINTQVVCDDRLKITDIVAHWGGSAHDSRIYNESLLKEPIEAGDFQGILLGEGGYKSSNHIYTPVINPASPDEENYNTAHILTRNNTIERMFVIWKSRFPVLLTGIRGSLANAKTTIVALAVLHNLAIEYNQALDNDDSIENSDIATLPENGQQKHLS